MKKFNNIINNFNNIGNEKYDEELKIVNDLFSRRKKVVQSISRYNKKLSEKQQELNELNKAICEINGHSFSDWEEHEHSHLDRCWYYTRKCSMCGIVERTSTMLDDIFDEKSYVRKRK